MANRRQRAKPSAVVVPAASEVALLEPKATEWGSAAGRLLPELPPYIENRLATLEDDKNQWVKCHLAAEEKQAFVRLLVANKFHWYRAAQQLGRDPRTVEEHVRRDPAFKEAIDAASHAFIQDVEVKNREMALQDKGVADRIFLLKALRPDRYSEKAMVMHAHLTVKTPNIR